MVGRPSSEGRVHIGGRCECGALVARVGFIVDEGQMLRAGVVVSVETCGH